MVNAFGNVYKVPDDFYYPRTPEAVMDMAQHFAPGLRAMTAEVLQANEHSRVRFLPSSSIFCSGALQTPAYVQEVMQEALRGENPLPGPEFRFARRSFLLESMAKQEQILRGSGFDQTIQSGQISTATMAGQIRGILETKQQYPFVDVRVLPREAERELNSRLGHTVFTHLNGRVAMFTEEPDPETGECLPTKKEHEDAYPGIQQRMDQAWELTLTPDDSRQWLEDKLSELQHTYS